ncbi:MAG: type II toxin-antitoxin system RelE/ParE family toxin [Prevotellaceae bacterium]|jgi:hypothetical protein|nr:type II toxin-antitoxin system RelE/ParE family toxin [Prevotellaceae bacterium]
MTPPRYKIIILPPVRTEINNLYDYIAVELCAPMAAEKYSRGIYDTIGKLAWLGGSIGVSLNENLQRQYGPGVRTIIYKNMSIIYNIRDDFIIVHSVKPGKNIK